MPKTRPGTEEKRAHRPLDPGPLLQGCKIAGMRLRWFEPNTCHTKPQVKAGDAELRHRLLRAKGAVHRTVGCAPWAMRGPDPAVGWLRLRSV